MLQTHDILMSHMFVVSSLSSFTALQRLIWVLSSSSNFEGSQTNKCSVYVYLQQHTHQYLLYSKYQMCKLQQMLLKRHTNLCHMAMSNVPAFIQNTGVTGWYMLIVLQQCWFSTVGPIRCPISLQDKCSQRLNCPIKVYVWCCWWGL